MCNSNNNINNHYNGNNNNNTNNDNNNKSLSNEIASFIYNLNYDDIDSKTINRAKIAFLDYLAVTLRGSLSNSTKIAIKTFNDIEIIDFTSNLDNTQSNINNHQSSIIYGHNIIKSDIITSGFVNGISAHALDLDDGHSLAKLHIGSVVFSSALAVAEAYKVTGKSFLESIIAAYDVAIAIGMVINPQHRNNGFHTTGTVGAIASAVVSSKLIGLNKNQIVSAIGLSGTGSAGLLESNHTGVMAKHLNVANAVRSGVTGAILAKNGFTGSCSIIEGKQGIISTMAKNNSNDNNNANSNNNNSDNGNNSNVNSNNVASIISNLGKFHINDIYIKKYPVCRHLHSSIDAVLDILANIKNNSNIVSNSHNHNFLDSIESVNIKTYKIACEHNNCSLNSLEDIRQSLPYSVAIAIIYGDLTEDIISDYFNINLNNINNTIINNSKGCSNDNTNNSNDINNTGNNTHNDSNSDNNYNSVDNVAHLANKVSISINPHFDNISGNMRPSTVEIIFSSNNSNSNSCSRCCSNGDTNNNDINSKSVSKTVYVPSGEDENPAFWEDVLNKFKSLNKNIIINDNFDISKLDLIKNIEYYKINEIINIIF